MGKISIRKEKQSLSEDLTTLDNSDHKNSPNIPSEPFIGPRSFRRDAEDQARFFGRDLETDEIISLISAHKLILVYAQSGAGKTSIFNAQVIPALEGLGFEILPMSRVRITSTTTASESSFVNDTKHLHDNSKLTNLDIFNAMQSLKPKIDPADWRINRSQSS